MEDAAMIRRFRFVTYALVGLLAMSGLQVRADSVATLASPADLDNAITKTLDQEAAARQTISALLQRDDVRKLAADRGLDVRRAQAAVRTLSGDELQRLSVLAADANTQLAGGDHTVRISLVAALLIVIIVILVAK
jgi:predicted nucleic acid-binding Zn ribbon protein